MIRRFCHSWKIGSKDIEMFGKVVGDTNPVHRDPEFAAKTRFKSPIAHGMTAIVMLHHSLPTKYKINSFKIRFIRPIYPDYSLNS